MANQFNLKGYMDSAWLDNFFTRIKATGANCLGVGLWIGYWMNPFVGVDPYGITFNRDVTRSQMELVVSRAQANDIYIYIRPFWSALYPDMVNIYQRNPATYDPATYVDAEEEYMAFLTSLIARCGGYSSFLGLTTMNEPPEPGWRYWEWLTQERYNELWRAAVDAIHQANPDVIAIVPAWHYIGPEYPYGTPNTMYYFHRYYRYDVVDNPAYTPHIAYYRQTPVDEPAAKSAYAQSLTLRNNIFRSDLCVWAEEQGWYGEYQILTKNPEPRDEPNWQIAMRHFYEILNEAGISWSHFNAFAYQSYGLWEDPDTVWRETQKHPIFDGVADGLPIGPTHTLIVSSQPLGIPFNVRRI